MYGSSQSDDANGMSSASKLICARLFLNTGEEAESGAGCTRAHPEGAAGAATRHTVPQGHRHPLHLLPQPRAPRIRAYRCSSGSNLSRTFDVVNVNFAVRAIAYFCAYNARHQAGVVCEMYVRVQLCLLVI